MNRKVVVWTTFNQWLPNVDRYDMLGQTHPALTTEWIKKRFRTWKETAFDSIMRQTKRDWSYAVLCHWKSMTLCKRLFSGLDQRITPLCVQCDHTKWLKSETDGHDEILSVRIDSDDMYHPAALQQVAEWGESSDNIYAYWPHGYAIDKVSKLIWAYETRSSGPFFVHRWKVQDLISHGRMKEPLRHSQVRHRSPTILPGRMFIVTINHGLNDSTTFNKKRFVKRIDGEQKYKVIKNFGLRMAQ